MIGTKYRYTPQWKPSNVQEAIAGPMKELAGDIQGVSKGGSVLISPTAGTKTLIHEIAHELLHQSEDRPLDKTILELEAESIAYVVARHFSMDGLASPNYIALHGANANMILIHLERIREAASKIINAIEISIKVENRPA